MSSFTREQLLPGLACKDHSLYRQFRRDVDKSQSFSYEALDSSGTDIVTAKALRRSYPGKSY